MATKKHRKPEAIRQQIVKLQGELAEAESLEKQRQRAELLMLVDRAKCLPEVVEFVRQKLAAKRAA